MTPRSGDYREYLLEKLRGDPEHCAGYLSAAMEEGRGAFLLALKDVVDAQGGPTEPSRRIGAHRVSIHKMLSEEGNPTLGHFQAILDALGMRIQISRKDTVREAS